MAEKRKRTIQDFFPVKRKCPTSIPGLARVQGGDNVDGKVTMANPSDHLKPQAQSHISNTSSKANSISSPSSSTIQSPSVPGLTLHENFITPEEEQTLLAFLNNPSKCTWRTDLSRRTMHFGGTYCLFPSPRTPIPLSSSSSSTTTTGICTPAPKPEILQAPPMPPELTWLLNRFTTHGIFPADKTPQYCIINEYHSNLGISAHVENFSFGEPVVGLSLLDTVPMRFLELVEPDGGSVRSGKAGKARRTGRRADVLLRGRGVCVMRGESRWRWQHEILRSGKGRGLGWRRVSLTFRWKEGG